MDGKPLKIPGAIKTMLLADERSLAVIKQSRLKALFTPDSIIITNQRIIRYSPSILGLHKEIEDYRYEYLANIKIDKGILFATITVKRRFMSEDLILDNLLKGDVDNISRLVQENLRQISGISSYQAATNRQVSLPSTEDPFQVLKLRFARGEITKEQFEEMKKTLE